MIESKTRLRMKILAFLVVFMFGALTTRLWFLQVLASDQFARQADDNQVRVVPIQPQRGEILDRNGDVLVANRPSTVLLVDRVDMKGREEEVLYRLSNLLHIPVADILDRLGSQKYLPYQPVPVAEDVPKEAAFYISEHRDLFPGVSYELRAIRDYPHAPMAGHILGYLGEISAEQLKDPDFNRYEPGDIVGKSGVEATYEHALHGKPGQREIQVNAQGRVLNDDFGHTAPVQGDNLVLSLDAHVQSLAERSLALGLELAHHTLDKNSGKYLQATGGAAIVMDPRTGRVLALASNPTFDPSLFVGGLSQSEAHQLDLCAPAEKHCPKPSHNAPLLDRATQALYPPGSTFKPFVAAAALAGRYASPNAQISCPGSYVVPIDPTKHEFHNWDPVDLGTLNMSEALWYSCDTVFYQLGFRFWLHWKRTGGSAAADGDEQFQRELRAMGFGRPTGIDASPEFGGLVPTWAYVKKVYKANPGVYGKFYGWLPGESLNLSIGQGFVLVTPMQLAVGYSAIANGGTLYAPRLGWKIERPDGRLVRVIKPKVMGKLPISRKQANFLREALTGVTKVGTAAAAFTGFPLSQIPVAGKTGTADVYKKQPYSWFAAIAPADHPKYVVVCLVEQGGHGSTTAAPVVRRILEGLFGLTPQNKLQAGAVVD